jgi:hypothetical protein
MASKTGGFRPRAGHGLTSDMPPSAIERKRNTSSKVTRNRNRIAPRKPKPVARRER